MLAPDGTIYTQTRITRNGRPSCIRASTGARGETEFPEGLHYSASLAREIQLAEVEIPPRFYHHRCDRRAVESLTVVIVRLLQGFAGIPEGVDPFCVRSWVEWRNVRDIRVSGLRR